VLNGAKFEGVPILEGEGERQKRLIKEEWTERRLWPK